MSDDDQNPRMIFGAFFDHHKDNKPFPFESTWEDFCAILSDIHVRDDKFSTDSAPGYSLALFIEKDGELVRKNKHVDKLSGIVIDFDTNFDIDAICKRLEGIAFAAHTTWKHMTEGEERNEQGEVVGTFNYGPRWRVIIPLSIAVPGPKYKAARSWVMKYISQGKGGVKAEEDTQASALSNFYYLPCCAPGNEEMFELRINEGPFLELPSLADFTGGIPQAQVLGNKIDWAWLKGRMHTYTKDPELRRAFKLVLKGQSFSPHGKRDTLLTRMCGALAGWAPQAPAEELAKIFTGSLASMTLEQPDDPPPSFEQTIDKVQRAQDGLQADAREHNAYVAENMVQEVELEEGKTQSDLDEIAPSLGLENGAELAKRMVLILDRSIWIWDPELSFWRGPMVESAAQVFARQELGKIPGINVWMRKQDGGLRLKTMPELAHDHGQVLRSVVMDLRTQTPAYNSAKSQLVLVGAPRRVLEAKYDEYVDTWLRALGGARAEKMLDWVASLTWLSRPNSVLFLQGDPDVGKGLLMRGLSRVWEVDSPTSMYRLLQAHGDFELTRCPLIAIDEGGQRGGPRVDMTTTLRELVTQPSRTFNRKHHDPVEITGYLRFIVSANNFNLFANDKHTLNPADRDAIAQRFLEITPDAEAREILLSVSDEERATLIDDDRIAKHALWLSENRKVEAHGRFIVPGEKDSRFAIRIVTEDHQWGSWTVEWLARYLSDPSIVERNQSGLVSRVSGRVIVSPEAVVNTFEAVLKNKQRPQSLEISNALKSLSTGKNVALPGGRGTGYEILVEEVVAWSTEKHIGNPSRIRANAQAIDAEKAGVVDIQVKKTVTKTGVKAPSFKGTK